MGWGVGCGQHARHRLAQLKPLSPPSLLPAPPQDFELACTPLQFWGRFLSNVSDFMVRQLDWCPFPPSWWLVGQCPSGPRLSALLAAWCSCLVLHTFPAMLMHSHWRAHPASNSVLSSPQVRFHESRGDSAIRLGKWTRHYKVGGIAARSQWHMPPE